MSSINYSTTPTKVDLFSQVMATKYINENSFGRNVAFQSFFGKTENGAESFFVDDATHVMIEIMKGQNKKSVFGTRGVPASNGSARRTRQGLKFSQENRAFPIVKDTGDITALDTFFRQIGEGKFENQKDRFERARFLAGLIYKDIITDQVWLYESLASESILTGKMSIDNKGGQFDFGRDGDNTLSAANPWTDTSNGTPLEDIDSLCVRVDRNGKVLPDFVGMSVADYSAFIRHPDVKEIADNRRYDIVYVGGDAKTGIAPEPKYQRHIDAGWTPRAYLTTESGYKVWIFTTTEWYEDENGDKQDYVQPGNVFVTSSYARFDRYFGPDDKLPQQFMKNSVIESFFGVQNQAITKNSELIKITSGSNAIIDPRMFKFYAFGNNGDSIDLEVQSAPIYACTAVDAVATMDSTIV